MKQHKLSPLKAYMVGGAVRDQELGIDSADRDWVVIGATDQDLLTRGFKLIDSDFKVFLHPKTHEQYALARTEAKLGHGYRGFKASFSPEITLEEDLSRRDLTINAMALDPANNHTLVDPFDGKKDLDAKILRHINEQFKADPLRVLRVARFAARFKELGFKIHEDTIKLMCEIAQSGELEHLTSERIWLETHKALKTHSPSVYFRILLEVNALERIMPQLYTHLHRSQKHAQNLFSAIDLSATMGFADKVRYATLMHDLGKNSSALEQHHQRLRAPREFTRLCDCVGQWIETFLTLETASSSEILGLIKGARLLHNHEKTEAFSRSCFCIHYTSKQSNHSDPSSAKMAYEGFQSAILLKKILAALEVLSINPNHKPNSQSMQDYAHQLQLECITNHNQASL